MISFRGKIAIDCEFGCLIISGCSCTEQIQDLLEDAALLPLGDLVADLADVAVDDIVDDDTDQERHQNDVEDQAAQKPAVFLGQQHVVVALIPGDDALVGGDLAFVDGPQVGRSAAFGGGDRGKRWARPGNS